MRKHCNDSAGHLGLNTGLACGDNCSERLDEGWDALGLQPGHAHDSRDLEFAHKFGLAIVEVISGGENIQAEAFEGDGVNVNSDFLDGLPTSEAKERMGQWLKEHGKGEPTINYKLRDWLFSRQRYWGEPFPVLHLEDGTTKLVPESDLPVLLPELDALKMAYNAVDQGASGVDMGRNIFQSDAPVAMINAVSKVVHEKMKPKDAFDYFRQQKEKGKKKKAKKKKK